MGLCEVLFFIVLPPVTLVLPGRHPPQATQINLSVCPAGVCAVPMTTPGAFTPQTES